MYAVSEEISDPSLNLTLSVSAWVRSSHNRGAKWKGRDGCERFFSGAS